MRTTTWLFDTRFAPRPLPDRRLTTLLGIETSCDETAAAVVADGARVLSNIVASQVEFHRKFGGVVPEIASRAHVEQLYPIIEEALASANVLEAVHTTHSLRVFGDLAYELGTVVGPVQPEGKPAQTVTFHFMATWRRQTDGTWRIKFMVGAPEPSGVDKPPE